MDVEFTSPGRTSIMVSSEEIADQVCDQKRFHKAVEGSLKEVRNLTGDGLFTAFHGENNWAVARKYNLWSLVIRLDLNAA